MAKKEKELDKELKKAVHEVLYQKYRPKKFGEVIGQLEFINMLKNAILENRISNAYIFSGPHGIGKTTLARIFAKSVNCLNSQNGDACNKCEVCVQIDSNKALDIIEIDAASNNGVDNIRDIIEGSTYLPSGLKYKVYIIDEAHMITTGGWNAFLKTLENASEHVIFIFATTEIQKIPKTILSRCQIYNLYALTINELSDLLDLVIKNEHITIDSDAKTILCELANGSARDLLSMVEQLLNYDNKNITLDIINQVFALTNKNNQFALLDLILNNKPNEAILLLNQLNNKGVNIHTLMSNLLDLSLEWYLYQSNIDESVLKQSNLQLFKNHSCNLGVLKDFISKLQDALFEIKKHLNQYIIFCAFIIKFTNNNEKQVIETNFSSEQNVNETKITNIYNDLDENANLTPTKNEYLDSFIINNKEDSKNKVDSKDEFIINAKKRIANLDEEWKNEKPFTITDISLIQDVTNELINKQNITNYFVGTKKESTSSSLNNEEISLEKYYVFAKYNINYEDNKQNVKKLRTIFKKVKEEENSKHFLLQEALMLIDKLILVNTNFIIFSASNKFNADKFNKLTNNTEVINELIQLLHKPYYMKAYTMDEIKSYDELTKNSEIDIKQYNNYIKNIQKINNQENDYEQLTKDMLFGGK